MTTAAATKTRETAFLAATAAASQLEELFGLFRVSGSRDWSPSRIRLVFHLQLR